MTRTAYRSYTGAALIHEVTAEIVYDIGDDGNTTELVHLDRPFETTDAEAPFKGRRR